MNEIVKSLIEERERLSRAIEVLEGGSSGSRGRGVAASMPTRTSNRRRRRHMSAEARARIAAAQRKRWAKVKAAKKK
jgi:hypothetical protein